MKKKILNYALCLSGLLALASCGSNNESSITSGNSSSTKPSTSESTNNTTNNNTSSSNSSVNNSSASSNGSVSSTNTSSSNTSTTPTEKVPSTRDITIYLAGDSTVKTYEDDQYIGGWGQYLDLFTSENVTVKNAAQGGRSSRSFINEGRLWNINDPQFSYTFPQNNGESIEDGIKEGDYLFIQFGHNDDATKAGGTQADRMVPLGNPDANGIYPITAGTKMPTTHFPEGFEAQYPTEAAKCKTEFAKYGSEYYSYDCGGTYKWYLSQYVEFAREKGAIPVLVTPVARVKFSGDSIVGAAGCHGPNFEYVQAVRQLADELDCFLIDLFQDSKTMLETATPTYANFLMAVKPNDLTGVWPSGYDKTYNNPELGYTGIEATHYNKYGAYLQAAYVATHINELFKTDLTNGESIDFLCSDPKSYVDPSNLMSKSIAEKLESQLTSINVTNPQRVYPSAEPVISAIDEKLSVEITQENYLEMITVCEELEALYISLNVDDRVNVTNYNKLTEAVAKCEELVLANRPKPTKVTTISFDSYAVETITSAKDFDGFKIVGASGKAVDIKASNASFTVSGELVETTKYVSLGGSASFNASRYIEFAVEGKCKVTVVAKSSGSTDRVLKLVTSSNQDVTTFDALTSISVTTQDIESAGTYKLGSAGSGIFVYQIIIEYFA